MSFTSIELAAPTVGVDVVIARTSGSSLAVNGPLSQGVFGIDSTGQPYYDNTGPASGETAVLGFDGASGDLILDSREAPDQHLMLLAGPVRKRAALRVRTIRQRTGQSGRAAARSRDAKPLLVRTAVPVGVQRDGAQAARAAARAR